MQEAAVYAPPSRLRELFSTILAFNEVCEPLALWNEFKNDMCEDYLHAAQTVNPQCDNEVWGMGLAQIERLLQSMGGRTLCEFNLPVQLARAAAVVGPAWSSTLVLEERAKYNRQEEANKLAGCMQSMNQHQRGTYHTVMAAVDRVRSGQASSASTEPNAFFVDGVGGAGKTFLYSCLLSGVRAQPNGVALSVASSGIAALLLQGGRTAHSRFKIPVKGLDKDSCCFISKQSPEAALIRAADLIVWDEAPMMHRHVFEAVDRTFRDITGCSNLLFGGKVVVMGGDFRQILPVVPKGNRGQIVDACLNKSSILWPHVRVCKLHQNMRVHTLRQAGNEQQAQALEQFAAFLKRVGEGSEQVYSAVCEGAIRIPDAMCCAAGVEATISDLIQEVYGGLSSLPASGRAEYIIERAILSPLNEDVDAINNQMIDWLTELDGERAEPQRVYLSSDSIVEEGPHGALFPTEYLNSLNFSGVPPHKLVLRVGCPIILLRNMSGGLANGTRLIVKRLGERVTEAVVATGPCKGDTVCIPRLCITPSDTVMPFTLRRCQFPVRPAFAMTVNKSQGQTFKMVGVYLPKPVFTHGQLYVSLSRVGCMEAVCVLAVNGWVQGGELDGVPTGMYTTNVVYREVLSA